jgi:aldehyde:ferredoxin oxidoreductase
MAGWDMVILEGRSPKPVYLHIENDDAELVDTEEPWGKTTWDAIPQLEAELLRWSA